MTRSTFLVRLVGVAVLAACGATKAPAGPGGAAMAAAPPGGGRSTWEELRKRAELRREAVTVGEEAVAVPAGSFECVVYTVREGEGAAAEVSRFYFARSTPGAPVFSTTDEAGARVFTQKLVDYRPGGA